MAQPVSSGDILEVRLLGRMNNQRVMNVLHYRLYVQGASSIEGLEVIEYAFQTYFKAADQIIPTYKLIANSTWAYEGVIFQFIWPTRYISVRYNDLAGPGAIGGQGLPPNVQTTLTKVSQMGSRSGIGSMHIGGLSISDVNQGFTSFQRQQNLIPLADLLTKDLDLTAIQNAISLDPLILNKTIVPASLEYNTMTVQSTIRVQRRRTVGLGE